MPPLILPLLYLITTSYLTSLSIALPPSSLNITNTNSSSTNAVRTICAGPWDTTHLNNGPMLMQKQDCIQAFLFDFMPTATVYQSLGNVHFYDGRTTAGARPLGGVGDDVTFQLPWRVRRGMCKAFPFFSCCNIKVKFIYISTRYSTWHHPRQDLYFRSNPLTDYSHLPGSCTIITTFRATLPLPINGHFMSTMFPPPRGPASDQDEDNDTFAELYNGVTVMMGACILEPMLPRAGFAIAGMDRRIGIMVVGTGSSADVVVRNAGVGGGNGDRGVDVD